MKKLKYLSTLLVAAIALVAAWLLWNFYTQSPWTRDGKVRAEQVGITPQVSGSILQLNVADNQQVKAGEVLFTLDDTPYRIAVLNAQAQLAKAQAEVAKAQAEQSKAASEARRRRNLSQNAISAEDLENANTALNTATTTLAAARAGHVAPMLPIDLFRRPLFLLSSLTAICTFAAQGLAFVSLPFYFEVTLGRSPVETGFLMTPWAALVAVMAPVAGRLSDRYSPGVLGGIGLAALAGGLLTLVWIPAHPSAFDIGWRMALCGIGFGFFQAPNLKAIMGSAPPERAGGASGVVATSRLIGQATGAALVAYCFTISAARGTTYALCLAAGFAAVASIASFARLAVAQPAWLGKGG